MLSWPINLGSVSTRALSSSPSQKAEQPRRQEIDLRNRQTGKGTTKQHEGH